MIKQPIMGTRILRKGRFAIMLCLSLIAGSAMAQTNQLKGISYSKLTGDRVQVTLNFSNTPSEPMSFTIDDPARIAMDFKDTQNALKVRNTQIGIGATRSVTTAEANNRTRVVFNLSNMVSYNANISGNDVVVTLGGEGSPTTGAAPVSTKRMIVEQSAPQESAAFNIEDIDFRRGSEGEARITLKLSDPKIPVDIMSQGDKVIIDIASTDIAEKLQRRMDVTDFATPVQTIDTFKIGNDIRIAVTPTGDWDQLAYQSDNIFTLEIKPLSPEVIEKRKKEEFSGERLSLNFQDIEVRSVLQLIADFTNLNVVVSDSVSGNLTLRLKNVPWDQALDIILKTKGLGKRQTGNVLLIAPTEEIAAREKLELEANKQIEELAPLRTEYLAINYANAGDIAALLKSSENSLLSERGSVTIDERTNLLLIQDTDEKLAEIRELINRLDIAVRQVLIESRIVEADDSYTKELGVRFGITSQNVNTDAGRGNFVSGTTEATRQLVNGETLILEDAYNVNLPAGTTAGSIGLTLIKLPLDLMLNLELSAAEVESRIETVSNPRVITSNQNTAIIETGTDIPYQQATSSGATSVSFKKAVLSLEVTPQITPDDRISMDIKVNKDSVGEVFAGVPSIDTNSVETQVLVDNGQTVVLGGIFEQTTEKSSTKVPFFGDLPVMGRLFRTDKNRDDKAELLIFLTPKLLQQSMSLNQ
jgi:type IV pilus assembly protein PilQ